MGDSQIEQVKQATDIVALIGERVKLTPAGRSLKGLCPFHNEKSPSFFVTPDIQIYKCFGCGASGDVLSFLQAYDGLTFPEALESLAKKAGITLKRGYKAPEDQKRDRYLEILHLAGEYYHYLLMEHEVGKKALDYAKNRGMYLKTIRDFKLGYAPNSWRALQKYLTKKKGYKPDELEAVGLCIKSKGGYYYDRFRHRLMFPLIKSGGGIVGFSGRILEQDKNSDREEPKYINSPETSLYHKSQHLFGMEQAKQAIHKKKRVIVVEGELDVISSYQSGVKEVVAVKGSSLTDQHLTSLKRLTKTILLAMDADAAGQEAMIRTIRLAEGHELNLRVIPLSGGKDPDELVKEGKNAWKEAIEGSVSIYDFYISLAMERHDVKTGIGQKEIMQFLTPILSGIANSVEQAFYVRKLAKKLEANDSSVVAEINRFRMSGSRDLEREMDKKDEPVKLDRQERLERYVLGTLLNSGLMVKELLEMVEAEWFGRAHLKKMVVELKKLAEREERIEGVELARKLPEHRRALVEELYAGQADILERGEEEVAVVCKQAIKELKSGYYKRRLVELGKALSQTKDGGEREKLQAEYREVSGKLAGR